MENQVEVWKDVIGYEGFYKVSNLGQVKSLNYNRTKKEKVISVKSRSKGYPIVSLSKNRQKKCRTVHQLVCEAFLNHKPCGYTLVINHKDYDRTNNNVINLELVTARQNTMKEHIKSSSKYVGVAWDNNLKKWNARILINNKNKHLGFFNDELEASKYYKLAIESLKNNTEILVKKSITSSIFSNVCWNKANKKWTSYLRINGKIKYLGSFTNEIDAYNSYQKKLELLTNM